MSICNFKEESAKAYKQVSSDSSISQGAQHLSSSAAAGLLFTSEEL